MPAKITAICFVHETNERLTQKYTVKEITAVYEINMFLVTDDRPVTNAKRIH
jgi:hypothetical protein